MSRLLIVVATHGDEELGFNVMKELEKIYPQERWGYDWIVGNPKAMKWGVRFTQADLNRSAPGSLVSKKYEQRRAAEILYMTGTYAAMIDIHSSTANCGIVTIIPKPTPENLALAQRLPITKNVIWQSPKSELSGPLTQFAHCPALEIECGPKGDPSLLRALEELVVSLIVSDYAKQKTTKKSRDYYEVYGKETGEWDSTVQDFTLLSRNGESFYPFMANQYKGVLCYKLKKSRKTLT